MVGKLIFSFVAFLQKYTVLPCFNYNKANQKNGEGTSTGCPNKHGNSVANSISTFKIIFLLSIVIPTEKAVICMSFVCNVHILFVYVLTAYGCT